MGTPDDLGVRAVSGPEVSLAALNSVPLKKSLAA